MRTAHAERIRGFSLMEVVVVVAVVALLSSIVFAVAGSARERSLRARGNADLASLGIALDRYRAEFGRFPVAVSGSDEERAVILKRALEGETEPSGETLPRPRAPFADFGSLVADSEGDWIADPWGTPYHYAFDPSWGHGQYFLLSPGPDGEAEFPDSSGQYDPRAEVNRDNLEGR